MPALLRQMASVLMDSISGYAGRANGSAMIRRNGSLSQVTRSGLIALWASMAASAASWASEHLGQGELCLQDGDVVAVAGAPVSGGERVRQDRQPLAQQRVDLPGPQPVAGPLQCGGVVNGGEAVIECLEPDTGPGGLPLRPVVPVDAQLGVAGK